MARDACCGQQLRMLRGHTGTVGSLALSADGLVVSGGFDGTVKIWEAQSGAALRTVHAERCYERADITGLTGIAAAQRAAPLALGAFEQNPVSEPTARLPLAP